MAAIFRAAAAAYDTLAAASPLASAFPFPRIRSLQKLAQHVAKKPHHRFFVGSAIEATSARTCDEVHYHGYQSAADERALEERLNYENLMEGERMAKTVKRSSGSTGKRSKARRTPQNYFAAAVRVSSLRNCIKTHLNLTDQDLTKPIGDVFRGQANPVDVIISELGNACYAFTPRQVYLKINSRPVKTVNDFIKYLGG